MGGYVQTFKAPLPIEVALLRLKINALQSASPPVTRMQTSRMALRGSAEWEWEWDGVNRASERERVRDVEQLPSLTYFSVAALRRVPRRRLHEDDEDGEDDGEDPARRPAAHRLRQRRRRHRRGGSARSHGGVSLAAILSLALNAVIPRNPLLLLRPRPCPSQRFA